MPNTAILTAGLVLLALSGFGFVLLPVVGAAYPPGILILAGVAAGAVLVVLGLRSASPQGTGATVVPSQPQMQVNTHSLGWMVLSFLVSFIWFKIDNQPLFPLGFVGTIIIGYWSADIDRAVGKPSQFAYFFALGLVGMIFGFFIR